MSRRATLTVGLSCLLAAIALGVLVRAFPPGLDAWAVDLLYVPEDSALGRLATAVSGIATIVALAGAVVVIVAARSRLNGGLVLRYAAVLALGLATMAAQYVFQRPGPPQQPDWTYPSGHATFVTAFVLLAALVAHHQLERKQAAVIGVGLIVFGATGVARVALAEHYPTDLAGGALAVLGVGLTTAVALGLVPERQRLRSDSS
jgi:membrane-associated phospholipid phosphatase